MPTSFSSLFMHLFHVSRGLPLPLEPCGFHWRACRVILFLPFLNVCPTHFHLSLPISVCIGTCPVLSHSCSFLILSVHFNFKIFLKHLLTNTWSLFMTPCVVFQVSQPYSNTAKIWVEKAYSLFTTVKRFDDVMQLWDMQWTDWIALMMLCLRHAGNRLDSFDDVMLETCREQIG